MEEWIGKVPGVESVTVNCAAGNATVGYDETRLEIADIKSAVRQSRYRSAGEFPPRHVSEHKAARERAVVPTPEAAPPSPSAPVAAVPKASTAAPGRLDDPSIKNADEVARVLGADIDNGLTSPEASRRLAQDGPNELRSAPWRPAWRRALSHFQDPLVYLLLAAIAIALVAWVIEGLVGWPVDAIVIATIVLLNGALGFVQQAKAQDAVAALARMTAAASAVLRDGRGAAGAQRRAGARRGVAAERACSAGSGAGRVPGLVSLPRRCARHRALRCFRPGRRSPARVRLHGQQCGRARHGAANLDLRSSDTAPSGSLK